MSTRYLFPCPNCGSKIGLLPVQAGQEIECEKCHNSFEAPKLGSLKQLTTLSDTIPRPRVPESGLKRTLFATGFALVIFMGISGAAIYFYAAGMIHDVQLEKQAEIWNQEFDRKSASELLSDWTAMGVDAGLGEWEEQPIALYRTHGLNLQKFAYGLLGLAGIGGLMSIVSFFMKGR